MITSVTGSASLGQDLRLSVRVQITVKFSEVVPVSFAFVSEGLSMLRTSSLRKVEQPTRSERANKKLLVGYPSSFGEVSPSFSKVSLQTSFLIYDLVVPEGSREVTCDLEYVIDTEKNSFFEREGKMLYSNTWMAQAWLPIPFRADAAKKYSLVQGDDVNCLPLVNCTVDIDVSCEHPDYFGVPLERCTDLSRGNMNSLALVFLDNSNGDCIVTPFVAEQGMAINVILTDRSRVERLSESLSQIDDFIDIIYNYLLLSPSTLPERVPSVNPASIPKFLPKVWNIVAVDSIPKYTMMSFHGISIISTKVLIRKGQERDQLEASSRFQVDARPVHNLNVHRILVQMLTEQLFVIFRPMMKAEHYWVSRGLATFLGEVAYAYVMGANLENLHRLIVSKYLYEYQDDVISSLRNWNRVAAEDTYNIAKSGFLIGTLCRSSEYFDSELFFRIWLRENLMSGPIYIQNQSVLNFIEKWGDNLLLPRIFIYFTMKRKSDNTLDVLIVQENPQEGEFVMRIYEDNGGFNHVFTLRGVETFVKHIDLFSLKDTTKRISVEYEDGRVLFHTFDGDPPRFLFLVADPDVLWPAQIVVKNEVENLDVMLKLSRNIVYEYRMIDTIRYFSDGPNVPNLGMKEVVTKKGSTRASRVQTDFTGAIEVKINDSNRPKLFAILREIFMDRYKNWKIRVMALDAVRKLGMKGAASILIDLFHKKFSLGGQQDSEVLDADVDDFESYYLRLKWIQVIANIERYFSPSPSEEKSSERFYEREEVSRFFARLIENSRFVEGVDSTRYMSVLIRCLPSINTSDSVRILVEKFELALFSKDENLLRTCLQAISEVYDRSEDLLKNLGRPKDLFQFYLRRDLKEKIPPTLRLLQDDPEKLAKVLLRNKNDLKILFQKTSGEDRPFESKISSIVTNAISSDGVSLMAGLRLSKVWSFLFGTRNSSAVSSGDAPFREDGDALPAADALVDTSDLPAPGTRECEEEKPDASGDDVEEEPTDEAQQLYEESELIKQMHEFFERIKFSAIDKWSINQETSDFIRSEVEDSYLRDLVRYVKCFEDAYTNEPDYGNLWPDSDGTSDSGGGFGKLSFAKPARPVILDLDEIRQHERRLESKKISTERNKKREEGVYEVEFDEHKVSFRGILPKNYLSGTVVQKDGSGFKLEMSMNE